MQEKNPTILARIFSFFTLFLYKASIFTAYPIKLFRWTNHVATTISTRLSKELTNDYNRALEISAGMRVRCSEIHSKSKNSRYPLTEEIKYLTLAHNVSNILIAMSFYSPITVTFLDKNYERGCRKFYCRHDCYRLSISDVIKYFTEQR